MRRKLTKRQLELEAIDTITRALRKAATHRYYSENERMVKRVLRLSISLHFSLGTSAEELAKVQELFGVKP